MDVALGMFWEKWFAEMEMEMEDEKRIRLRSVCVRSRRMAGTVRRWHPTAQMSGRRARRLPTSGGRAVGGGSGGGGRWRHCEQQADETMTGQGRRGAVALVFICTSAALCSESQEALRASCRPAR